MPRTPSGPLANWAGRWARRPPKGGGTAGHIVLCGIHVSPSAAWCATSVAVRAQVSACVVRVVRSLWTVRESLPVGVGHWSGHHLRSQTPAARTGCVGGDRWVGHTRFCRRRVDQWPQSLSGWPGRSRVVVTGATWVGRGRAAGASATWGSLNAVSSCRRIHSARTIVSASSSTVAVSVSMATIFCHPLRLARRGPELSLGVDRRFLAVVIDLDTPWLGLLGHRDGQP